MQPKLPTRSAHGGGGVEGGGWDLVMGKQHRPISVKVFRRAGTYSSGVKIPASALGQGWVTLEYTEGQ